MDKKIIKSLIDEKLETIQEQFSIIRAYEGKIPNIEIDLVMANVRDLYELFITLQAENLGPSVSPKTGMASPVVVVSDPAPEVRTEQAPTEVDLPVTLEENDEVIAGPSESMEEEHDRDFETEAQPSRRSPAFLGFEPVIEPQPAPPVEHTSADPPQTPVIESAASPEPVASPSSTAPALSSEEPHESPVKHPKITFDLFTDSGVNTLADRLRNGQEKRVADRLQENKTVDLRTTIGINDKFLFINELFEGNMRVYDEAVQKLSDSYTLAQADIMLLDLKISYNWDSESPTVKKFVELVRKKFH